MKPSQVVTGRLGGERWVQQILGEASVHRPRRGRVWVASFTGPFGGQEWKTTGRGDHAAALLIAKEFEAAARAQRAKSGSAGRRQRIRNRQSPGRSGGGLTQQQVASLLGLSVRGVRAIERRALRKPSPHPRLPAIGREYLAGELTEQGRPAVSPAEIKAHWGWASHRVELDTMREVLEISQGQYRNRDT